MAETVGANGPRRDSRVCVAPYIRFGKWNAISEYSRKAAQERSLGRSLGYEVGQT